MSKYCTDREFSNYVHETLAKEKIYKKLCWKEQCLSDNLMNNVDMSNAVDYFFVDTQTNDIVTVQERFREMKYQQYNDFTIRYERKHSLYEDRKKSEYYKLDSQFFVYGIIDSSKAEVNNASDFIKFAVIDIRSIKKLIDEEKIIVDKDLVSKTSRIIDGKIVCPIKYNVDRSSSFIAIDIKMLIDLFGDRKVVIMQKGFL